MINITNFTKQQKGEQVDWQIHYQELYSKRLAGFTNMAAKEQLFADKATEMGLTPELVKTFYISNKPSRVKSGDT